MSIPKKVGVIGLGAIGMGVAQSLRRAGHHVHVHDIRLELARAFAAEGGVVCESPAALAQACDVVVSAVFNAAQSEAALFGSQGVVAGMARGGLFVMCSTVDPGWSEAMEERLAGHGLLYLEAPVSGGEEAAVSGTLTIISAGRPAAYEKADGILEAMAANVYRVGARAGAGSTVKLISQLLVCVHQAAAAEAMALAIRRGVDPQALYDVITHSFSNSVCFEKRITPVISGDYASKSALDILVKDLGLVLQAGRDSTFPLPLASTAHQMFLQASAAGHGREAVAAVIKIFPGIRLPEKQA
ncbi:MAG TPA: L-threonate dehydrogenase [Ramlibacter sp.]|nr:L-threonate dehydrogenase [Ramlibacter sp.]